MSPNTQIHKKRRKKERKICKDTEKTTDEVQVHTKWISDHYTPKIKKM